MTGHTIIVYDAQGRELAREPAKSRAKRLSVRASRNQAQLEDLASRNPGTAGGEIVRLGYTREDGTEVPRGVTGFAIAGGHSYCLIDFGSHTTRVWDPVRHVEVPK